MPVSEVYLRDATEYLKTLPTKYIDLAPIDCPYGIGEDGRKNHTRSVLTKSKDYRHTSRYDNQAPDAEYFKELFRVSKNQIIWGANHFISLIPYDSSCWLVWDKDNGMNDFADCELAWTSFNGAVRKIKYRWNGMLQQEADNKEERIHPNQKPISLYRWIYQTFAKDGDKILDTHLGSQNSRVAAYQMGLDFYGCEIDPIHFANGNRNFEIKKSIQRLF